MDGHNATVGGAAVSRTSELDEKIRFVQNAAGTILSPQVAWLTLQGIKTLSARMERQSDNAMVLARFLESHPKVRSVTYPGLPSHPQHGIAKAQMSGFSGIISFELEGGIAAGTPVMNNVELMGLAESLGAVESMITHPATMTHAEVPDEERRARGLSDGLVRLSVGIEDVDDILADLDQALAKA